MIDNEQQQISFEVESNDRGRNQPLAARMRPRSLDEFTGQADLLGPGKLLRRAIEADRIQSMILYGPPGTGKTSLGQVIAEQTRSTFVQLNAVESNIADIRRLLVAAKTRSNTTGIATVVFVDELHRFNKTQQDALLPQLEAGAIKLIGATTENPLFSVTPPLVSRSQIFTLQPLSDTDLVELLRRALRDKERGLGTMNVSATDDSLKHLARISDGDARRALNALEIGALTTQPDATGMIKITLAVAEQSIQKKALVYGEDAHYEVASAYQKAMRGSDPDAALYWLAKMIRAGEDPRFIARRMVVCASEDVGLADSTALLVATAALNAVESIGWPEAKLQLAHATIYIATAPKSNSATRAMEAAEHELDSGRTISVPAHLQDQHYRRVGQLGQNAWYRSPHDYPGHFVAQDYLGIEKVFYHPTGQGKEKDLAERVENLRRQFHAHRHADKPSDTTQKSKCCATCDTGHRQSSGEYFCNHATVLSNQQPPTMIMRRPEFVCEHFQKKLIPGQSRI